jgi:hypothetical protein
MEAQIITEKIQVCKCGNCGAILQNYPTSASYSIKDIEKRWKSKNYLPKQVKIKKHNLWSLEMLNNLKSMMYDNWSIPEITKSLSNSFGIKLTKDAVKIKIYHIKTHRCATCGSKTVKPDELFCFYHLKKHIGHRQKTHNYWKPEWKQRLKDLKAEGKSTAECRATLNQQFQIKLTYPAVNNALYRYGILKWLKKLGREGISNET